MIKTLPRQQSTKPFDAGDVAGLPGTFRAAERGGEPVGLASVP